ncbi:BsuPI-related putative proteinase inhibitor [Bacillus sp. USDA818B3_A]|uniref:BsuPI-related putative proteinase inhibitor n=1 Tax=Bacillus sp. USDA818B3_A TaxID=2698834 RepID=UPI0013692D1F|nr:BsuPI-related putative proteinase inhibitor [Bacillus sp. USDA818B3_A]
MRKKNWLLVIGLSVSLGLLSGCGTGDKTNASSEVSKNVPPKQDEIAANFLTDIVIKEENGNILVHYTVKNISGKPKKLTFRTGLEADYIVYDASGKKIKQYSDEVMSTQVMKEMVVENNQVISKDFTIIDLPNGQYKLEVFLTADEEEAKAVKDLIIKNSFPNGKGVYIGQIDPHTIEMDIEGEKIAFQLTDTARRQLASLKEGEEVSFYFIVNEQGQKVIQKFIRTVK